MNELVGHNNAARGKGLKPEKLVILGIAALRKARLQATASQFGENQSSRLFLDARKLAGREQYVVCYLQRRPHVFDTYSSHRICSCLALGRRSPRFSGS